MSYKKNEQVVAELNIGRSIQDQHPYSSVMHSDRALSLIQETEAHCNSAKDFMIIIMACYYYEQDHPELKGYHYPDVSEKAVKRAVEWYENIFVPYIIKYMQEQDPEHADEYIDEHNWMFFLERIFTIIGAIDAQDFNKFARNQYGEAIKASIQAKRYTSQKPAELEAEQ